MRQMPSQSVSGKYKDEKQNTKKILRKEDLNAACKTINNKISKRYYKPFK
jgi:hypothetical protein